VRRLALVVGAVGALTLAVGVPGQASSGNRRTSAGPHGAAALTPYNLVHGCYSVRLSSGHAPGPFRMQAAALGQYLLYNGQFLQSNLTSGPKPSIWTVGINAQTISNGATCRASTVWQAPKTCAAA
jgi:hypothetical protein